MMGENLWVFFHFHFYWHFPSGSAAAIVWCTIWKAICLFYNLSHPLGKVSNVLVKKNNLKVNRPPSQLQLRLLQTIVSVHLKDVHCVYVAFLLIDIGFLENLITCLLFPNPLKTGSLTFDFVRKNVGRLKFVYTFGNCHRRLDCLPTWCISTHA